MIFSTEFYDIYEEVSKKKLLLYIFGKFTGPSLPKYPGTPVDRKNVDNRYFLGRRKKSGAKK